MTHKAILECRDLSVWYGPHLALERASLTLDQGQILGVAGPNGAGKSSMIMGLLGLADRTRGLVRLNGVSNRHNRLFRKVAARIAYVPQKQAVATQFPITVQQVVEMGQYGQLGWFQRPNSTQRLAVERAIHDLELSSVANHQFSALSGGQQQKTLVARAIAQSSDLLVLDEPFRGVDANSQRAIASVLLAHRANGGSAILVHHGAQMISQLCDSLAVVNGTVLAQGTPEALLASAHLADLVGGQGPVNVPAERLGSDRSAGLADSDTLYPQPQSLAG